LVSVQLTFLLHYIISDMYLLCRNITYVCTSSV